MGGCTQPEARQTLIERLEDSDEDVRDWATFGLGSLSQEDSPEIREALRKRLDDPFEGARLEAIWGLAQRKEQRGLKMLLERLESESRVEGDVMAAEETLDVSGDTPPEELCDGLRKLSEH
jgi:hypothetical protein